MPHLEVLLKEKGIVSRLQCSVRHRYVHNRDERRPLSTNMKDLPKFKLCKVMDSEQQPKYCCDIKEVVSTKVIKNETLKVQCGSRIEHCSKSFALPVLVGPELT